MTINLGTPQKKQPTKIWIGINIEFIQPTRTLFQKILNLSNYFNELDFDISVMAIDQNKKMTDDKCFVFYNQPSSIGINIDTFQESPVAPEFDEIISVDFLKISTEIKSLKFVISNHRDDLFENCEISFFVYEQPIWTGPSGKELFDFKIKPTVQFNLIELFEIHITQNHFEWELEVLQNPIVLSKQNNLSEYIKLHKYPK
jgi:stress response protein SCP2